MKTVKVVHLTSVHPVEDSRIFYKECGELVKAGYDVYLVAAGESDRFLNGVHIVTVRADTTRIKRISNTARHIYKRAAELDADIYHLHDPELIMCAILLRFKRRKVIYDAHEDLPLQILSKPWVPRWFRRPLSKAMACALWFSSRFIFSAIVAAEPTVENKFPPRKTVLVQNFPILDELQNGDARPYETRPKHLAYIGGISRLRCISEMIKAIERLRDEDVRLVLGGKFESDLLLAEVSAYQGWAQVNFEGWMDRKRVRDTLSNVRAGLVLLYPEKTYIDAQPIKLYEYMAASLPVIACDFPLHKEIVEEDNCGLCVDPMSPEQIARAIQWIFNHPDEARMMGENGRHAVEKYYSWNSEGKKLLGLYERLLTP